MNKQCKMCEKIKPIESFVVVKNAGPNCKECREGKRERDKVYNHMYWLKNIDNLKKARRQNYMDNKERYREYQNKLRKENRKKLHD